MFIYRVFITAYEDGETWSVDCVSRADANSLMQEQEENGNSVRMVRVRRDAVCQVISVGV